MGTFEELGADTVENAQPLDVTKNATRALKGVAGKARSISNAVPNGSGRLNSTPPTGARFRRRKKRG